LPNERPEKESTQVDYVTTLSVFHHSITQVDYIYFYFL